MFLIIRETIVLSIWYEPYDMNHMIWTIWYGPYDMDQGPNGPGGNVWTFINHFSWFSCCKIMILVHLPNINVVNMYLNEKPVGVQGIILSISGIKWSFSDHDTEKSATRYILKILIDQLESLKFSEAKFVNSHVSNFIIALSVA